MALPRGREGNVTSFTTPRVTTIRTHYHVLSAVDCSTLMTDDQNTCPHLASTAPACLPWLFLSNSEYNMFKSIRVALCTFPKEHSAILQEWD